MPIVTTLHTVLPSHRRRNAQSSSDIVEVSAKVVVMAEKGRELLRSVYGVPAEKIEVIPHGIPDCSFAEPDAAKSRLGFAGRSSHPHVRPAVSEQRHRSDDRCDAGDPRAPPDAVYVVLGATHPNLVRGQGEAYRESLVGARARSRR